jgi:hypothetical protein
MMLLEKDRCPECGEEPRGTVETGVVAEFEAPDEEGGFEYSGDTDLQDQATVKNEKGESLVVCANGHEWFTTISEEPGGVAAD